MSEFSSNRASTSLDDHHPVHVVGLGHHLGRAGQRRRGPGSSWTAAGAATWPSRRRGPGPRRRGTGRARGVGDRGGGRGETARIHLRARPCMRPTLMWCRPGFRHTPRSEADIPADGRPGCPRRPIGAPLNGGIHMLRIRRRSPSVYRPRRPTSWPRCIGAAKADAGRPALHPRPPLPAGRGDALGRRPGRLLRAVPDRRRRTMPSSSSSAACTSWPSRPTC